MTSGDEDGNFATAAPPIGYPHKGAIRVEDRTIDIQRIAVAGPGSV